MTKIRTSVKRFKLQIAAMANIKVRIWNLLDSLFSFFRLISIGTSGFKHKFELSFFYDGVRNHKLTKIGYANDGTVPSPNRFSDYIGFFIGRNRPNNASDSLLKPIKEYYFSVRNRNVGLIDPTFTICIPSDRSRYVNSALTIHNSREISNLMLREDSSEKVCHRAPILYVYGEV